MNLAPFPFAVGGTLRLGVLAFCSFLVYKKSIRRVPKMRPRPGWREQESENEADSPIRGKGRIVEIPAFG